MSYLSRCSYPTPPRNLCDLLLRDIASLLITSELISSSLTALRPECEFSPELTATLDFVRALSDAGGSRLHQPLTEAGAVLPAAAENSASTLITGLFHRLPVSAKSGLFAAELAVNLRLLAQHVELKARLAAEEAVLVGFDGLSRALVGLSADWRACGRALCAITGRARAQAYVADVGDAPAMPEA